VKDMEYGNSLCMNGYPRLLLREKTIFLSFRFPAQANYLILSVGIIQVFQRSYGEPYAMKAPSQDHPHGKR